MSKPKLFISHSTNGLSETDRCVEIKEHIYSLLSGDSGGWDVFLDKQRIKPGDRWRTEIIQNLAQAQAGVILFNKQAMSQSNWVTAEALILCFHKSINPKFQLISVFLEGLSRHDTCFKRYEPFQLNEIQAVDDNDDPLLSPEEFVRQKIAPNLDAGKAGDPPSSEWATRVRYLLEHVNIDALGRAAKQLELIPEESLLNAPGEQQYQKRLSMIVAERMHHMPPMKNVDAFRELLKSKEPDAANALRLMKLIEAKWVENEAVEILLCAARKPEKIGLLTINACNLTEINQYLERARIEIQSGTGTVYTVSVDAAAGEGDEVDLRKINDAIKKEIFPSGNLIIKDGKELTLPESIKYRFGPGDVVICGLSSKYAREPILKKLREQFPMIIFLVQVGTHTEYLFSWNDIPGNDNGRLIGFLKKRYYIDWAETAKIDKIDDGKTIKVSTDKKCLYLKLNDEKTEANLKIDDVRTNKLIAKMENGKLNIYPTEIEKLMLFNSIGGKPLCPPLNEDKHNIFFDLHDKLIVELKKERDIGKKSIPGALPCMAAIEKRKGHWKTKGAKIIKANNE